MSNARRTMIAALALAVLPSCRLAALQCPDGSPPPCAGRTVRPAAAPTSVAVLYFDNLSRDSSDAFLADGLTEERKLLDLNLLIYAVNRDSAPHRAAHAWLEEALSGGETVALPWVVILGFLRLTTNPRMLPRPLTAEQAMGVVTGWLARPSVVALHPADEHWSILRDLLIACGTAANLTTDAHLAALAIEHGAELCSADGDFARFKRLRWVNPLLG